MNPQTLRFLDFHYVWPLLKDVRCPEDFFGPDITYGTAEKPIKDRHEFAEEAIRENIDAVNKALEGTFTSGQDYLEKLRCYATWALEKIQSGNYGRKSLHRLKLWFRVVGNGASNTRMFQYHEKIVGKKAPGGSADYDIFLQAIPAYVFEGQMAFHHHKWTVSRQGKDVFGGDIAPGFSRHQDGLPWFNRNYKSKEHQTPDLLFPWEPEFEVGDILIIETTSHGSPTEFFFSPVPGRGNSWSSIASRAQEVHATFRHFR